MNFNNISKSIIYNFILILNLIYDINKKLYLNFIIYIKIFNKTINNYKRSILFN